MGEPDADDGERTSLDLASAKTTMSFGRGHPEICTRRSWTDLSQDAVCECVKTTSTTGPFDQADHTGAKRNQEIRRSKPTYLGNNPV